MKGHKDLRHYQDTMLNRHYLVKIVFYSRLSQMIVASGSQVYVYLRPFSIVSLFVLNVKALVGAFNQEKALVGAFSVIVQLHRLIDLRH